MAEIRVRTMDYDIDPYVDDHGHKFAHNVEVMIIYRDGTLNSKGRPNGSTRWNVPPPLGCICPWMGNDPDCPVPVYELDEEVP